MSREHNTFKAIGFSPELNRRFVTIELHFHCICITLVSNGNLLPMLHKSNNALTICFCFSDVILANRRTFLIIIGKKKQLSPSI